MENFNLEASSIEVKTIRALQAIENQRNDLLEKGKKYGSASVSRFRRALTASTIAGLSFLGVGCGATEVSHNDTSQTTHKLDRFERASEKMDEKQVEHDQVREIVRKAGIEIGNSDVIYYKKINGQLSSISVNGQEVWKDENNQKPLIDFNQKSDSQNLSPERKINSDIKDFL